MRGASACEVAVATRNEVKVRAVRRALQRLGVRARVRRVKADGGEEMPRGWVAVVRGARRRARLARLRGLVGVGVEAGLWRFAGRTYVICAAVVEDGDRIGVGFGPAFRAPRRLPRGSAGGAVAVVSGGKIRRQELIEQAVAMAWIGRE
jgi:non-canonical (house-cleaning) NTP pyrophosphatase